MTNQPSEVGEHPTPEVLLAVPASPGRKRDEDERDEDDRWSDLPCTD